MSAVATVCMDVSAVARHWLMLNMYCSSVFGCGEPVTMADIKYVLLLCVMRLPAGGGRGPGQSAAVLSGCDRATDAGATQGDQPGPLRQSRWVPEVLVHLTVGGFVSRLPGRAVIGDQ